MALPPDLKLEVFLTIGNYRLIANMTELVHNCALIKHLMSETATDQLKGYLAHFSANRIKNLSGDEFSSHFPGLEIHRVQGSAAREITHWYLVTDRMAAELNREAQPLLTIPSTALDPRDEGTGADSTLWGRIDTDTPLVEDPTILTIFDRKTAQ